tara:strand:- start:104 stop:673 length:570 start_codon:yes stop_codon:yes gene_type:complete
MKEINALNINKRQAIEKALKITSQRETMQQKSKSISDGLGPKLQLLDPNALQILSQIAVQQNEVTALLDKEQLAWKVAFAHSLLYDQKVNQYRDVICDLLPTIDTCTACLNATMYITNIQTFIDFYENIMSNKNNCNIQITQKTELHCPNLHLKIEVAGNLIDVQLTANVIKEKLHSLKCTIKNEIFIV